MSNEFSKLVRIVATLGSFASKPESEAATDSWASMDNAEALRSRSEPPEAPAIAAGGPPTMRRESVRRGEGARRAWDPAEAELLAFGDGVDWRRKRRAAAAAAIGEEGGVGSGSCLVGVAA
jgi:hypothetical protein